MLLAVAALVTPLIGILLLRHERIALNADSWPSSRSCRRGSGRGTGRVDTPAQRTLLLWDPSAANFRGCTLDGVEQQLGRPAARLPAPAGATVLVYDTDPKDRFDPAR